MGVIKLLLLLSIAQEFVPNNQQRSNVINFYQTTTRIKGKQQMFYFYIIWVYFGLFFSFYTILIFFFRMHTMPIFVFCSLVSFFCVFILVPFIFFVCRAICNLIYSIRISLNKTK